MVSSSGKSSGRMPDSIYHPRPRFILCLQMFPHKCFGMGLQCWLSTIYCIKHRCQSQLLRILCRQCRNSAVTIWTLNSN